MLKRIEKQKRHNRSKEKARRQKTTGESAKTQKKKGAQQTCSISSLESSPATGEVLRIHGDGQPSLKRDRLEISGVTEGQIRKE